MEHPTSHPPLCGWTASARGLLIALATALALGLLWASRPPPEAPAPLPHLVVDLNTAPMEALGALPRVGPTLAGRIATARAEAPFRSLDDVDRRVRGIGPATLRALRPYVRIGPPEAGPAGRPADTSSGRDAP